MWEIDSNYKFIFENEPSVQSEIKDDRCEEHTMENITDKYRYIFKFVIKCTVNPCADTKHHISNLSQNLK